MLGVTLLALSASMGCSNSSTNQGRSSQGAAATTSVTTNSGASGTNGSDPQSTTTMFGMGPGSAEAPGDCPSRMPGETLSAEEAVVKVNTERICPAYVTVAQGTPVTWHNDGNRDATVTVTEYTASAPGQPLAVLVENTVSPGREWAWTPPEATMFAFRIDIVPAFMGTIEVQGPGGDTHTH